MADSSSSAQPLDPQSAYEEAGNNYRQFCLWREKIVGGYIAILGGLGIGFHQSEGHCGFQFALLSAAILVSVVFWIFNLRNSDFIRVCQRAARELEPKGNGVYSRLNELTPNTLTHGLAVNILVFAVTAASGFKIWVDRSCWYQSEFRTPFSVAVGFALIPIAYEIVRSQEWHGKRKGERGKK